MTQLYVLIGGYALCICLIQSFRTIVPLYLANMTKSRNQQSVWTLGVSDREEKRSEPSTADRTMDRTNEAPKVAEEEVELIKNCHSGKMPLTTLPGRLTDRPREH